MAIDRLAALGDGFRRFAEAEAAGYSPLYERLALGVAEDAGILALAAKARPGQPAPNLLFGAVHYLLLKGYEHRLRRFYPSLDQSSSHVEGPPTSTAATSNNDGPFSAFRDFCVTHAHEIESLLATRLVQTNEVGRSACLLPAFNHVAALANGPLALLEVGSSAGLNLLFDGYHYDYGDLGTVGDPSSRIRLQCEVCGGGRPPVEAVPAVAFRAGCDLNVVDVTDPDARLWLRALVWPEHGGRAAVLEAAMELAGSGQPLLVEGDAVEVLPALLDKAPSDLTVCVFHTMVMNQVPAEGRGRFYDILRERSWRRPIFEISMLGARAAKWAEVELARNVRGEWRRALLARCHPHGLWLEWLAS